MLPIMYCSGILRCEIPNWAHQYVSSRFKTVSNNLLGGKTMGGVYNWHSTHTSMKIPKLLQWKTNRHLTSLFHTYINRRGCVSSLCSHFEGTRPTAIVVHMFMLRIPISGLSTYLSIQSRRKSLYSDYAIDSSNPIIAYMEAINDWNR